MRQFGEELLRLHRRSGNEAVSQFARRMLKPGGHIILFTSCHLFGHWVEAFNSADMVVMQHPMIMVKISSQLQRSNSSGFPQNAADIAMIARSRGSHPAGFKVYMTSQYCLIQNTHKRNFNVMGTVPIVRKRLVYPGTRARVRVEKTRSAFQN